MNNIDEAIDQSARLWFDIMIRHGVAEGNTDVVTIVSHDPEKVLAAITEYEERDPAGYAMLERALMSGQAPATVH
jgi:hypothetical protein